MNYLYPYQSVFPQEIPRPTTENEDACFWEDDGSYGLMSDDSGAYQGQEEPHPVIRVVKKNKKERRRTQSINNAFSDLRECIPNVPFDTKLSKIKTLRLATSYIGYLMGVLENDDYGDGFKADLSSQPRRSPNYQREETKKNKGRTGWPQHVWALELKQESV